jgi:N-acetylglutamate synthase-like GNAT family acetyltransferase
VAVVGTEIVGFLALKHHFRESCEVHIIAVDGSLHRHGIGQALLQAAEADLRRSGVHWLSVKTLSPSDPDEGYAKTRAFYTAMGFAPLQELLDLWNADNPALIMVKMLE